MPAILLTFAAATVAMCGGGLYTAWPTIAKRRAQAERAQADARAQAERQAKEKAAAEQQEEERQRLLANPTEYIIPTVIRGLDPLWIRVSEENAQKHISAAEAEQESAEADPSRRRSGPRSRATRSA